ncbi:MAG: methyltransferase type 11 [Anaerolineaceae bacterium]|nr:methyltransferase type 11 [Anaerolineaceae bacterium]
MDELSPNSDVKQVVAQGYDQVAKAYAELENEAPWPRMRWVKKLLQKLPSGSAVLDLGCGSGDPADVEIAKAHAVTGVDISQAQIALARQKVPSGRFLQADVGSVTFPDASFDAVITFYTLEHLPRTEHGAILQRIYHWLRHGGYFLLSTEAGEVEEIVSEWLGVPMYFSCFDPETLKQMVQAAGFEILETAVETQSEGDDKIPYLWLLAQKPED